MNGFMLIVAIEARFYVCNIDKAKKMRTSEKKVFHYEMSTICAD